MVQYETGYIGLLHGIYTPSKAIFITKHTSYTNSSDIRFDRITALKHVATVAIANFV